MIESKTKVVFKLLRKVFLVHAFAALIFVPDRLSAEGFYIDPQSAEGMGAAQSGAAVGYRDGSAAYYNPAALTTHQTSSVSGLLHGFQSSTRFHDEGSTVAGQPNRGSDESDGGKDAALPQVYGVIPVNKSVVGGLYINSPFGLGTEYARDWVGRYQAVESQLRMINMGSAFGVDCGNGLSLGAGAAAVYADAKISNAIDFGSIGAAALGPQNAANIGLIPQQSDGFAQIEGHDWSWNWNTGALYRYGENSRNRLGISYRSKTTLDLHGGDATFVVPPQAQALTSTGAFTSTGAQSTLVLPEMVTLGSKTFVSQQVALMHQSTWTRWNRFQDLTVTFDNPAQPPSTIQQDWENSWFHSAGIAYTPVENIELRAGVGYDQGIIPNASRRYPRLPTSDSVWGSIGVGVEIPEKHVRIDLAYTRVEFRGGRADSTGATGDQLHGEWDSSIDAVSSGITLYW